MDIEKQTAANKRHLCVFGCVWEEECGSVPHIVCNVTRKDNDLQTKAQVFQADSILWCRSVVANEEYTLPKPVY